MLDWGQGPPWAPLWITRRGPRPPGRPPIALGNVDTLTTHAVDLTASRQELPAALTALGDVASTAALSHSDVRLHVIACQAHHEARHLLGAASSTPSALLLPTVHSVRGTARRVRAVLDRQQRTPTNAADIAWLLELAEAVPR